MIERGEVRSDGARRGIFVKYGGALENISEKRQLIFFNGISSGDEASSIEA